MAKKIGNQLNWSFEVKNTETETAETDKAGIKKVSDMINLIGAKEITEILFKDKQDKVVGNFTLMELFKEGTENTETIKHIKQQMKLNENIAVVQLIA
jgi:hypothetical protein